MEVLVDRCAGLDVHKRMVTVCVRTPGDGGHRRQVVRTFRTFAHDLADLASWLADEGVTRAVMESTGILWRPVYRALEGHVEQVWLANAQHVKAVPARKTDVKDAVWLCQLAECGLVSPSFVPPEHVRRLRDLTRYRRRLIESRTKQYQRLDKLLEDAGIKLSSVASTMRLKSVRLMVEAMIDGESDPAVLAGLALKQLKSKNELLRFALSAPMDTHHRLLARNLLEHLDQVVKSLTAVEAAITDALKPHETLVERLCTIPGVDHHVAAVVLAEIGTDISVFPTAAHLASWARMCPGNKESAGRRHSGRNTPGNHWLRTVLHQAAWAASRTKGTFLASRFAHLRRTIGPDKAAQAIGHSILVAVWHMLHDNVDYHELGGDWHATRRQLDPAKRRAQLIAQLEGLTGQHVTLTA
jgi:transposase